jgi:hypothetical protein
MRLYSIATVLDLRRKIHPATGEPQRTNANETEKRRHESRNRLRPHRRKLTQPTPGVTPTPAHVDGLRRCTERL